MADVFENLFHITIAFLPTLVAALTVAIIGLLYYLIPSGILLLLLLIISKFTPETSILNKKFKILGVVLRGKYWGALLLPLPVFGYITVLFLIQAWILLTG